MLTKVLPEWFRDLQDGAAAANKSIKIAYGAIIMSILGTVGVTAWQLWVAREYQRQDSVQQDTTERLLRDQLLATKQLKK